MLNNFHNTILTPGTTASVINIIVEGVVMKEEPNLVSQDLKFSILMVESLFINLCDSSNKNGPSFFDVVVPLCVNSWPVKK